MTGVHKLVNAHGASATILPFGATLVELRVPDRHGTLGNVVLGLDDASDYARPCFDARCNGGATDAPTPPTPPTLRAL